jgi:hypothetical protein
MMMIFNLCMVHPYMASLGGRTAEGRVFVSDGRNYMGKGGRTSRGVGHGRRAITCNFAANDALARYLSVTFEHRTPNVQHRTSKDGFAALRKIINQQKTLPAAGLAFIISFEIMSADCVFRRHLRPIGSAK